MSLRRHCSPLALQSRIVICASWWRRTCATYLGYLLVLTSRRGSLDRAHAPARKFAVASHQRLLQRYGECALFRSGFWCDVFWF